MIEAEFLVQALQMRDGIWQTNWEDALNAVREAGSLTAKEASALGNAYELLRRCETVLRRGEIKNISTLPAATEEQQKLGVRLGLLELPQMTDTKVKPPTLNSDAYLEKFARFESDPESAANLLSPHTQESTSKSKPASPRIPGTRRYVSSDGWEILVGRTSQDNDFLTFKIAKPNDLWLHAGDYGGSHVVVRNPTKKEVPHRTLIEAAQLAAFFSQARKNSKADVHYTERKFVSKPKGAKPGLVRLQRFKNITVEPKEAAERTTS